MNELVGVGDGSVGRELGGGEGGFYFFILFFYFFIFQ